MPKLTLNRALVVAGARYEAGAEVDYSGDDVSYLVAAGFVSIVEAATTSTPPAKLAKRTKAQIEADLAAAKAAEAALQADLSQASE